MRPLLEIEEVARARSPPDVAGQTKPGIDQAPFDSPRQTHLPTIDIPTPHLCCQRPWLRLSSCAPLEKSHQGCQLLLLRVNRVPIRPALKRWPGCDPAPRCET